MGAPEIEQLNVDRHQQRLDAIHKAQKVRAQRGHLRQALKKKEIDPWELLAGKSHPLVEELASQIKLRDILPMIPGIGKSRTMEIIYAFEASVDARLGSFSEERRRELVFIAKGAQQPYFKDGHEINGKIG